MSPRVCSESLSLQYQVILAGLRQPVELSSSGLCSFQGNSKDSALGSHGEVGQGYVKVCRTCHVPL